MDWYTGCGQHRRSLKIIIWVILTIVLHERIICLPSRSCSHYWQYVFAADMAIHHLLSWLDVTLIRRLKWRSIPYPRVAHELTNEKNTSFKKDCCLYPVKPWAFGVKTWTARQRWIGPQSFLPDELPTNANMPHLAKSIAFKVPVITPFTSTPKSENYPTTRRAGLRLDFQRLFEMLSHWSILYTLRAFPRCHFME